MKKLIRLFLLTAAILSISCVPTQAAFASADAEPDGPDTWDWIKVQTSSGRMTIRTRYAISGIQVYDGGQEDAYLEIYQDYEGFYFILGDPEGYYLYNLDEENAIEVDCSLIWRAGEEDEFTEVFHELQMAGDCVIPLTSSERGITGVGAMQNALDTRSDTAQLCIRYPSGQTFWFEIPKDTDYDDVWSVASDFWYFPTYNDELYLGSEANPDLIKFLNAFYVKISDAFEEAKASDTLMASDALRAMINSGEDAELTLLYNQYQLLMEHTGGLRTVDYEQIEIVNNWYSQTILAQDVQDGLDVWSDVIDGADELSPLVRGVFGDFVGDSYDDTIWIIDGLLDLFA